MNDNSFANAGNKIKLKSPAAVNHYLSLNVDSKERKYILYLPSSYDGEKPVPLVIMLHGGGGTGQGAMNQTGWHEKAEREGFIAVFPEARPPFPSQPSKFRGNPQVWNDGSGRGYAGRRNIDDVGFIRTLIAELENAYRVDTKRIYITGFSNGASMALRLGTELSDIVAAVGVGGGYLWIKDPVMTSPVSLIYFIGSEDPLNLPEGGEVKLPWGGSEYHPPVIDSIHKWIALLKIPDNPKVASPETGLEIRTWQAQNNGAEVRFYMIEGLGHVWAGGNRMLPAWMVGHNTTKIKATDTIWGLFKNHPKQEI